MAWNYSEKTQKLFMDAVQGKPGTHLGEISDPDGFGEHGSIACGDAMRFTFRVERHPSEPLKDIIKEAKYLTFGCTSAIAASEALCTLIEEGQYTPHRGASDPESGHRQVPGRSSGPEDPLLGHGRRGARGRGLQLGPEAKRRPFGAGHRAVRRREGRGPGGLQVLLPQRALFEAAYQGARSPNHSRGDPRHQGGRRLHGLPPSSRRLAGSDRRSLAG